MRSWHRGPTSTCSEKHQLDAQKNRNNQKTKKKSSSQSIPRPFFYRCFTQRMTCLFLRVVVAKPQELTKAFVALGGDVQLMTNVCPRSSQRKNHDVSYGLGRWWRMAEEIEFFEENAREFFWVESLEKDMKLQVFLVREWMGMMKSSL